MANAKKVVTGKVRGSYVNVFRPRKNDMSGREEYSMMIIIPKSDKQTVGKIQAAAKEAANDFFNGKVPKKIKNPLRDAEREAEDSGESVEEHLKGAYFMNIKSATRKPGIVDRENMELLSAEDFQSGDYCRVSINAYGYDVNGNRGVAFGLNNVMVLGKGEPLGNVSRPEDDFSDDWEDDDMEDSWD